MSVPPEFAETALSSSPTLTSLGAAAAPLAMVPFQSLDTPTVDPLFRYVSKEVIMEVATHIGVESLKLVRHLDVSEDRIADARGRYPGDCYERSFCLLTDWLKMAGEKGSVEVLKDALKKCGRNDLAISIDREG